MSQATGRRAQAFGAALACARWRLLAVLLAAGCAAGCSGGTQVAEMYTPPVGDPEQGKAHVQAFRCGACHTIPGVQGASGLVGPPLSFFARRTFVAGEVPNVGANLVKWIRDPKSIEPGTAMPTLGLSEKQAGAVAGFLYTLR